MARMVWRNRRFSALASETNRACGPPTAKVENTCRRWRGGSAGSGMDLEPLPHKFGPVANRAPAEFARLGGTVEPGGKAPRFKVAQARPRIAPARQLLHCRLHEFDCEYLRDRLRMKAQRTAGGAAH